MRTKKILIVLFILLKINLLMAQTYQTEIVCVGSNKLYFIENSTQTSSYEWGLKNGTGTIAPPQGNDSIHITWSNTLTADTLWVVETPQSGCTSDTAKIIIQKSVVPQINLGNNATLCTNQTMLLNAENEGATYLWSTGETTPTITVSQSGTYAVTVQNLCGTVTDNITINYIAPPIAPATVTSSPSNFCIGEISEITLSFSTENFSSETTANWYSNQNCTQLITTGNNVTLPAPTQNKTYYLQFQNSCGVSGVKSVTVTASNCSMETQTICQGEIKSYWLETATASSQYTWGINQQTGNIIFGQGSDSIVVQWNNQLITDTLWVLETTSAGCNGDTSKIKIEKELLPILNLGEDFTICTNTTTTLNAFNNGLNYLWSNGSVTQTIEVSAGTYWVEVNNGLCAAFDTITILPLSESEPPTSANSNEIEFCKNTISEITLSYVGGILGTNAQAVWYAENSFTNSIGVGNNLVVTAPTETTT